MTTFVYKETTYHNAKYFNRELKIYRIKNNKPEYIGLIKFSTSSTRGAQHEAFNYLMDNGYIPKKFYKSSECAWRDAGYFYGEVTKHYNIIEV